VSVDVTHACSHASGIAASRSGAITCPRRRSAACAPAAAKESMQVKVAVRSEHQ